jgi:glycosyltransferase involved in cell wall biosynthesis
MEKITIIIHSYHFKNINECVKSARLLTSNIIIVGEENIDGVKIIPFPRVDIVEKAREFAIKQSQTDWVFLLDADERMTPELAEEVKKVIESDQYSFYKVPRKEIIFQKKWLKHGGWWPNYQTRLIKKEALVSWPKEIHSTPVIKGEAGYLTNHLLHYSQNDIEEIVKRTIVFEDMESDLLDQADKQVDILTFFRKFLGELYRRLIKRFGFLDGEIGIIESIYQAFSKTITYLYLYEKKHRPLRPLP